LEVTEPRPSTGKSNREIDILFRADGKCYATESVIAAIAKPATALVV